ncbi:QacE family quaternary ammonium compound efflux SMR transporter [Cohnella sp. CIP 111063]|uniref:DMT family transporter n=1 Tax=unclassified Cohnella TaxID=2636738 RepID=UPI000B8C42A4|nr:MULTISPECIES: multidrug efflux SMR transporter [unclassified Cohnella]OXS61813.1 QacE family quaternary ammonium compound efflux SMR transporter [Cohnella sp. CIP 111063]PRX74255.1 small multidrug resistance pump [Cohnella sp. SGD-V74]
MTKAYLFLALAIVSELFGTSMLKASEGFSRLYPSIATIAAFSLAFYSLSLSLQQIPLGVAYAIWSGVGTALTAVIGIVVWKETASLTTALGLVLIVAGVVVLNLKGSGAH